MNRQNDLFLSVLIDRARAVQDRFEATGVNHRTYLARRNAHAGRGRGGSNAPAGGSNAQEYGRNAAGGETTCP